MKKSGINLIWNSITLLIGILVIVMYFMKGSSSDLLLGVGSGILGVASVSLYQGIRIKNNKDYAKQVAIKNEDERNQFISTKSRAEAFGLGLTVEAIIAIAYIFGNESNIAEIIGILICVQLIVYLILYMVNNKKY